MSESSAKLQEGAADPGRHGSVQHETVVDEEELRRRRMKWLRVGLLALLFLGSLGVAKLTGLDEWARVDTIRELVQSMGVWGAAALVISFGVGELFHVPGFVFMGAASIAYGPVLGSGVSYVAAVFSTGLSFVVVRAVGGQPLGDLQKPWMRKVLARLETHPVRTMTILRLLLWVSPALNYALAMSSVRFRDYILGSALGLILPVPLIVVFFDLVAEYLL